MSEQPKIRPEVVALFAGISNLDSGPNQWQHADGRPLTRDERELALSATYDEIQAVMDYSMRVVEHREEQAAAWNRITELTAPYFAGLPEGTHMARVLPLMTAAERAELVGLMDLVAPDGTYVPPTA